MDVVVVCVYDKNLIMCSSCEDKFFVVVWCIECMDFFCYDCRNVYMRLRLIKIYRVSVVFSLFF